MKPLEQSNAFDWVGHCEDCKFWHHVAQAQGQYGACVRYPPTPFIIGHAQGAIARPGMQQPTVPVQQPIFPNTLATEGCGEFRPRPTRARIK
jgi:hypothetical protein